jgi:bifunctional non-homologous end joining protein LigD
MSNSALLAEYNRKRDFEKTAEPAGKIAHSHTGDRFIVQKHEATRLHWDFRLEADGVLKSWAVTKGPSPDPDIKRLAVRTEDHPLSYAEFEGIIPEGEYGGGNVMLWDKGTWEPVKGKSWKDLEKGHLHFVLHGERMKGEWLLIRLKKRPGEKRENWLLRKLDDEYAQAGDPLVEQGLTSVLTGRTMAEIEADKNGEFSLSGKSDRAFKAQMKKAAERNAQLGKGRKASKGKAGALPKFRAPQLATLVDDVPAGNGWMHEIKFDGYRALVACAGDKVRVYTRKGLDWSDKFAPLVERFRALDLPSCLIDGEIVAYDKQGNPDFSSLQQVLKRGRGAQKAGDHMAFHAFDLLEANSEDLTGMTNVERKERLEALLADAKPPIHVADDLIGAGEKLYRTMCEAGQEGIISKRIDARYAVGKRSRNWLKVKCTRRQEFVIIGWKKSSARGRPFSSLLLAQNEGGHLVYKGNVGTGFNQDSLADLAARFAKIERKTAPAEVGRPESRGVTWLEPKLVAEVAFSEFTADGNVRHGSYLGLRGDK